MAGTAGEVEGLGPERLGDWAKPLNRELEARVLRSLTGAAAIALSSMPGEAEADERALAAGNLSPDVAAATAFRLEKKRLLVRSMQGLALRGKEVAAMKGVREAAAPAAKKGEKPKAATERGFGAAK